MDKVTHVEKKVFSYIERYHMIAPGDKIVAGVSGGADSVCLLSLLVEYGRRVPISLGVVHVNHGLRAEAGEDARYVEDLCRQQDIPFYLTETDVREFAAQEKCSEEDAGRRVRYQAFYQAAAAMGGARIAVAHNMGDNAETMLFHLFRGSGLKGLCGIAPVRGAVIHPILCLERREVEEYLRERRILWRTDSTNGEDHYRRNRIRHHILPYAEREVTQGAAAHMCRTAELLSEAEDYLEQQTRAAWEQCVRPAVQEPPEVPEQYVRPAVQEPPEVPEQCVRPAVQEPPEVPEQCVRPAVQEPPEVPEQCVRPAVQEPPEVAWQCVRPAVQEPPEVPEQCVRPAVARYTVDVDCFRGFHIALRKRILLGIAKALSPTGKDISAVHVEDALRLFEQPGNRDLSLPFGICAKRRYGEVILERPEQAAAVSRRPHNAAGDPGKRELPGAAEDPGKRELPGAAEDPEMRRPSGAAECPGGLRHNADWEAPLPAVAQGYPVTVKLENGERLEFDIFFGINGQEVPRNQYTKWLDYDKMIESPVVRFRKKGDFLMIADREGRLIHKTLKEYMIAEKIPREQRGRIPVLAMGSHVLWLAGYRISEYFKISGNTNHILQVQLKKGLTVSETEEENVGTH